MTVPGYTAEAALSGLTVGRSRQNTTGCVSDAPGAWALVPQAINPPIVPDPRSCRWICDEYGCVYHCGPWRPE